MTNDVHDGPTEVTSEKGMVASQHPLAVEAAARMLAEGGTAADAAVAAAAVLTVVDPRSTGLGGDVFAMYWQDGAPRPVGLTSVGVSPASLTIDALRRKGHDRMPIDGPLSITVPGAPAGWEELLSRFGKLDRARVLAPAIQHAREGFRVSRAVAEEWTTARDKLLRNEAAAALFLVDGQTPTEGQEIAFPDLARTLEEFARSGAKPFYHGEIAERIGAEVEQLGGLLRTSDLAAWRGPDWVEPISASFRGMDVYEMPPPGQGLVVLQALRIYEGFEVSGHVDEDHVAIEAIKLAYDDANLHIADPDVAPPPVHMLLGDEHIEAQRGRIRLDAVLRADVGRPSDTVYVAVADAEGGACSFIQSVYDGFGSGVVVPGTGLALQNRGSGFTLVEDHPNAAGPRKRPYHTIIPAMLGRGEVFAGAMGVVGGYMQPQGQLQLLRNVLDRGMSAQGACDAPRFRVYREREVALEDSYHEDVARGLAVRGHDVTVLDPFERGGAQLILRDEDGFRGGSDKRKDGHVHGL